MEINKKGDNNYEELCGKDVRGKNACNFRRDVCAALNISK